MKVKPIKVKKIPLIDVPVGSIFTLGNAHYVKLAHEYYAVGEGVPATTVNTLVEFDSVYNGIKKMSLEERAVNMFLASTCAEMHPAIITYGPFNADDFRVYCQTMSQYIKDCWYVDNGTADCLTNGEYLYVDEFCNLCKGNEYDEKEDGVSRRLGIRVMYWLDPESIVRVKAE